MGQWALVERVLRAGALAATGCPWSQTWEKTSGQLLGGDGFPIFKMRLPFEGIPKTSSSKEAPAGNTVQIMASQTELL